MLDKFVACAVGQEHRLGRWFRIREARNALCLISTPEALHTKPRLAAAQAAATRARLTKRKQRTPAEQQQLDDEDGPDGEGDDDGDEGGGDADL